ncbi:MAG TPA: nucleotide exchange factor GrpE [Candidatus Nitrosocosmicus sp.]|jgi:molecular chaperone GrpE|nr:nucleotide exchange factor GrpE [Candidatus Nitrosocosmicus sp.]
MTYSRDSSDDWASGSAAGGASPDQEAELLRLREALEAKSREADAARDRYVRTVAEFDNARKRAVREREELIRGANESLIRELLPVLDNFERALQAARGDAGAAGVTAGVELIQRELLRVLEKFGVTAFSSVGAPFDPERHEAVARVPAAGHPEMTVVGETARGYLLNGRVLRPAMVTVAMNADSEAGEPNAGNA